MVPIYPVIIRAPTNFHNSTNPFNRIIILISTNELIDYLPLLEKMPTAFFNISLSILTSLSSFCSALNSVSSADNSSFFEKSPPFSLNSLHHLLTVLDSAPYSSLTSRVLRPVFSSSTIITLNSLS
jgi:hypothetical protein